MTSDRSPPSKHDRLRLRARRHRLTGVGTFQTLLRTGRRRDGHYLQIVSAPAERETGRIGFVIGRKALPLAVDRNRLRRLLRVAVAHARPAIEAYDVIVRLMRRCTRSELTAVAVEAARLLDTLVQAHEQRGEST